MWGLGVWKSFEGLENMLHSFQPELNRSSFKKILPPLEPHPFLQIILTFEGLGLRISFCPIPNKLTPK